jgi:hypothetical protein
MSNNDFNSNEFRERSVGDHGMTQDNVNHNMSILRSPISRPLVSKRRIQNDADADAYQVVMDRRIKDVMVADNDINFSGYKGQNLVITSVAIVSVVFAASIAAMWYFGFFSTLKTNSTPFTQVAYLNPPVPTPWAEPSSNQQLNMPSARSSVPPTISPVSAEPTPVISAPQLTLAQKLGEKPVKTVTPENREQAQASIARAERIMVETKDISAARLFLERALQLGEPKAALLLGETYDPTRLKQSGVKGITGDAKKAKALYEEALAGGITDAKTRLNELK